MEDSKQFHINIFKDGEKTIETSTNRAEAYIILANEELNNKNRDLLTELKELQAQNDILTEENERMEVTINNQRGMLHNLHNLNLMEKNLSTQFEKINDDFVKQIDELKYYHEKGYDTVGRYIAYFIIAIFFQTALGLIDPSTMIMITINLVSLFYFTLKFHGQKTNYSSIMGTHNSFRNAQNKEIKRIQSEINETKRGTDHISDFIDSL